MESIICLKKDVKKYYVFITLLYIFLVRDALEQRLFFFSYFDEILALLSITFPIIKIGNSFSIRFKSDKNSYWCFIFLFISSGIVANLFFKYQPFFSAALPDMFLCTKFWLWIELSKNLFKGLELNLYSKRIFRHIRLLTWFYFVLTVIDNVFHIFPSDIRFGIRSTQLFYFHSTSFASCVIFLMAILLLIRSRLEKRKFVFYEVLLSLLACSSLRSKIIGSVIIFWLIVYFSLIRKKKITVWTMLLFVPPVLFVGWDQIQYYFFSDVVQGSARYQLLTKSFNVANDHFPLGAGYATFGSYYSGLHYSPLYSMYGISSVHGLMSNNISFISDSFWPMILGQTGYLGLLCYGLVIYKLFRKIQEVRIKNIEVYATGLFLLIFLLIESTSAAAFVHPIYLPLSFVIGYTLSVSQSIKN